jgi:hypothetical protein
MVLVLYMNWSQGCNRVALDHDHDSGYYSYLGTHVTPLLSTFPKISPSSEAAFTVAVGKGGGAYPQIQNS